MAPLVRMERVNLRREEEEQLELELMEAMEEVGTFWIRSLSLHPGREGAAHQMGEQSFYPISS